MPMRSAPAASSAMTDDFLQLANSRMQFRFFLLSKLPAAYFAGVRILEANANSCRVKVPYKWFSKNPFHSTYFACLAMAAEMSTGALAMAHLYKIYPKVSMLITHMEGQFIKKATGITVFQCNDGEAIRHAIAKTIDSGKAAACIASTGGYNTNGELIAQFSFTWSFRRK